MQAEAGWVAVPAHKEMAQNSRQARFGLHPTTVQVFAWIILISCGLAQAWWTRHLIFSDGVSYLDIADNYARGDWRNALNEYWSPLHSWILAIVFKLFHPPAYWQVATLHAVNFAGFCAAIAFLEVFLAELLRFRPFASTGLSDQTIRVGAYSSLLIAGLWHITMGYVSPDMVTMAILILIAYFQLRIANGRARPLTYFLFGGALALAFLSRAAFAPVLLLYIAATLVSLRMRRRRALSPLLLTCSAILLLCAPFVIALSVVKGHLTWGSAGPPNYAWEVDGAPRSVHWQGRPPDLGTPKHATRKMLEHPATFEFAIPVAGTYPPWYEPSYWYAGISPRFYWQKQLIVIWNTAPYLVALFLASPIAVPCLALILGGDKRNWISRRGILAYWFLWLPLLAYIAIYVLVFLDKRYIGGALAILWTCLSASVSISWPPLRRFAGIAIQVLCIAFVTWFVAVRMKPVIADTLNDAIQHRESEWNMHWILAQRFRQLGVKAGDRIAFIGNAMDCEWARQLGARIVAEVPVIWNRRNSVTRPILEDYSEVEDFWSAPPATRARVLNIFRRAGASIVVAERLPAFALAQGWNLVLPLKAPHLLHTGAQFESLGDAGYLKIGP